MKIFGMGGFELVIILIVILLIFGPKNLPKLGSALGKTVSNLRSGMNAGKKEKEENAEGEQAEAAGETQEAQLNEIEGQVEAADTSDVSGETVEFEDVVEEVEAAESETSSEEVAASVDEEAQAAPKKVRRVVKKKVSADPQPEE